eukprot:2476559-Rhodomonas_salina.1
MACTDPGYAATKLHCLVWYWPRVCCCKDPLRCAVLTERMLAGMVASALKGTFEADNCPVSQLCCEIKFETPRLQYRLYKGKGFLD